MLVGLGGNNGTTLVATVLANRHNISWGTRDGIQTPNYLGSLVRASTMRLGVDDNGDDVYVPLSDVLPMVHPNDLVVGGWDISALPLDGAMRRAKVLEYDLQRQLAPLMAEYKPLPSIYYPTFINANQGERANNVIPGQDKQAHLDQVRRDIREFKQQNDLDQVIVLWTANTERYSRLIDGVNDTAENLLRSIERSHDEVSPSTIFAVASILEGVPYINGAPNNTFVPGAIQLAEQKKAFIAGDDFKSGQTKVKSVLAEYLVNAGIKVRGGFWVRKLSEPYRKEFLLAFVKKHCADPFFAGLPPNSSHSRASLPVTTTSVTTTARYVVSPQRRHPVILCDDFVDLLISRPSRPPELERPGSVPLQGDLQGLGRRRHGRVQLAPVQAPRQEGG